jgi:intracellular multiplication protein IcmO
MSYQGGGTGEYAETRSAEVREVAGVDWRDLQSLIEGEAIILFGGRRIYAKLFHAEIDTRGPMRLNRPVALAPPDVEALKAASAHVGAVLNALEGGLGAGRTKRSATLAAMLGAFQQTAAAGQGGEACVEAALEAAKDHPIARDAIEALAPHSPLEAMLTAAAGRPRQAPLAPAPTYAPVDGPSDAARETLESIEASAGSSRADARTAATLLLAAAQALEAPPGSSETPQEFAREIEALTQDIRVEGARLSAGDAPTGDARAEGKGEAASRSRGAAP